MSMIRPPLTTSMTGPLTTPSSSLIFSMLPQARSYWARFLESTSRPSLSSFWRTRASILSPEGHDLVRVDVVADRQLAGRDHALGLVPDVEEHLVPVDLDDRALDDLAVLDVDHRLGVGVVERHATEVVLDHGPRDVTALLVEGAHPGVGRAHPVSDGPGASVAVGGVGSALSAALDLGGARLVGHGRVLASDGELVGYGSSMDQGAGASNRRSLSLEGCAAVGARNRAHRRGTLAPRYGFVLSPVRRRDQGRRATSRNSGWSRSGRVGGVADRASPTRACSTSSPHRTASNRSSRGVKQLVHSSTSSSSPSSDRTVVRSRFTPVAASKSSCSSR